MNAQMETTPTLFNGIEADNEPMETDSESIVKKSTKKVSWASDKELVTIHYFEMDESERGRPFLHACVFVCVMSYYITEI